MRRPLRRWLRCWRRHAVAVGPYTPPAPYVAGARWRCTCGDYGICKDRRAGAQKLALEAVRRAAVEHLVQVGRYR